MYVNVNDVADVGYGAEYMDEVLKWQWRRWWCDGALDFFETALFEAHTTLQTLQSAQNILRNIGIYLYLGECKLEGAVMQVAF